MSNSELTQSAQYYITLKIFDSSSCTIQVDRSTVTSYKFNTASKPKVYSVRPMVMNPDCMYKHLRYSLEMKNGNSMPGFLDFYTTATDRFFELKKAPTFTDIGIITLVYKAEYNPLIF